MTVTQFGYCPNCDERHKELVPVAGGTLACHSCGAVGVYDSKERYEEMIEDGE